MAMATTGLTTSSKTNMMKSPTIRRILREAAELTNAPSSDYMAEPLEADLLEWHFTLRGPPNSVYSDGIYHGRIVLPPAYPLRPPSFRFTTPNGRFEVNREICLSISGHHEETWQPAWGIRTALVALRSFMETDAQGQLGGLETSDSVRRRLAKESTSYKCAVCVKSNADIIAECNERCKKNDSQNVDIHIPTELTMSWRDEMESSKPQTISPSAKTFNDIPGVAPLDAELAEGFIQTVQATSPLPSLPNGGLQNCGHQLPPTLNQAEQTTRPTRNGVVPVWIDRAIVALIFLLIALLLRVLLGV